MLTVTGFSELSERPGVALDDTVAFFIGFVLKL